MTRGNQRDMARAKNQKKQQEIQRKKNASEKTGLSLSERKARDAELMREKQRKKEDQTTHGKPKPEPTQANPSPAPTAAAAAANSAK